ncbi:protein EPIDERMAL PATTERNING FACTOR 1 isoform X2 [Cajanus cajan]|uniref:protein EPIDERMAL PATTERNING FACTOR 1 isoform X2 n=1 Tax=Cajanus cajan TaxID=3821 RepID=UPI00098D7E44|nr:protein EPIDERMAL PATTERNING FACTOR 1 isoform X2 [Cajanus cajan]
MRTTSLYAAAAFLLLLLCVPQIISARHINPSRLHGGEEKRKDGKEMLYWEGRVETVEVAGSRLPDCSHACGSCSPCRLVMVSFVCASLAEAESCPMAYRCMCHNKSYPVP